jgi:hypothetical protein
MVLERTASRVPENLIAPGAPGASAARLEPGAPPEARQPTTSAPATSHPRAPTAVRNWPCLQTAVRRPPVYVGLQRVPGRPRLVTNRPNRPPVRLVYWHGR